jgi:hypothetical protein
MSDEHTETCRCGGTMKVGFLPDQADMAAIWVAVFVEGTPQARAGMWDKLTKGHGVVPWSDEEVWAIEGYRCQDCGRLELFAKDRPQSNLHRK